TFENSSQPKYTAGSQNVRIGAGDVTASVTLVQAATIVGRLRDADTQTLLTGLNAQQFLPDNFSISAEANPWVPGGFMETNRNGSGPALDANTGQFAIQRLIPDTIYDVTLRGYQDLGQESLAKGQRTYAPTKIGGVRLGAGQILDLGTIDLSQGGTL